MSLAGPMGTYFGLQERKHRWIDMIRRNQDNVSQYRCFYAPILNDAYGDPGQSGTSGLVGGPPTQIFEVPRGRTYISPSLRRSGRVFGGESQRGLTRALFDLDDFAPDLDAGWVFIRWQEFRPALGNWVTMDTGEGGGAEPVYGPIYVVPTPEFFGAEQPSFSLHGTAPANTDCAAGSPPDFNERGQDVLANPVMPPLHIVLPAGAAFITVKNLAAVGGANLLLSYGPGMPMSELPPQDAQTLTSGQTKEVVLASDGAAIDFNINGVVSFHP